MTYLRHAPRHVHQTMVNHLTDALGALGWVGAGPAPFGAEPFKIVATRPVTGGKLDSVIDSRTIAVSLGSEFAPDPMEMGGPLAEQEYPFFVDVFSDSEAICLALASDIRDIFLGRLPGTRRHLTLIDQVLGTPVPGWQIELDDVQRHTPEHTFALHWGVVNVTAVAHFSEVSY